ncbi:MAG: fibronectin type III domain-containing protein, partial [Proteobacteria bacterium]|nr:fibronectin type III domain-containing protein [Pseudomonadota bacterium]
TLPGVDGTCNFAFNGTEQIAYGFEVLGLEVPAALTLPAGYQAVRLDTQANFTADLPVGTQFIIQSGVGYWRVTLRAAGAWSPPELVVYPADATLFTSCSVGAFNTSDSGFTRPAGYTGTFVQVMPCTGPSTAPTGGMIFDSNGSPQYLPISDWNTRAMNRMFTFTANNALGDNSGNWIGQYLAPKSPFADAIPTRMIKPPATAPGTPTTVTASAGNAQATVSFIAPASNGGSAITAYTVTSSPGGLIAKGAASPLTVTGLTNGTAYTFTVKATNAVGDSAASAASISATPASLDQAAADKATAAAKVATDSLAAAKTAMDSCAALVKKVTDLALPVGFSDSVTADLSNTILRVQYRAAHPPTTADGKSGEIDSKLLKAIPQVQLDLIASLKTASANMDTGCKDAVTYKENTQMKQATADVKAAKFDVPGDTAANNKSRTDAVTKGITDYLASSQALAAAMAVLSNNRIHQAYTGPVVRQFLGPLY